MFEQEVTR